MAQPAVYTIPAGVSFVDAFAAGLRELLGEAPEALAAARILLPTRRACRSLTLAFVRQAGGRPLLLPRMTPLGDLDEDEVSFDEMTAMLGAAGAEIPPAIPALRRQLLLARHVVRVMGSARTTPAQAAQLAGELGRLFDQIHTERLDIAGLDGLVPDDLARHWQVTLEFLRPIATQWQETLRAEGCIDPADRRRRLLEAQAAAWRMSPPTTPVIAAGSTGSLPATADLMAVIAGLPQGAVVLPGLDTASDAATWKAIDVEADDPAFASAQAHPQFGLAHLLRRLGVERASVRPWPAPGVADPLPARADLLARALAPASCPPAAPIEAADARAFAGVTLVAAASPEEEARTIALLMRGVLEAPDRTAALVTPDRALARRVAVELHRWDIAVDDSGGRPLAETPPAAFLRLIAQAAAEALAPVPLLAVLGHPLAAGGRAPAAFRSAVRALELRALRGLRPAPGIDGLRRAASRKDGANDRVLVIVDTIEVALHPLIRLFEQPSVSPAEILAAQIAAAEALAATDQLPGAARLWAGDDGEALAGFAAELAEALRQDQPMPPSEWPELFDVLLAGRAVRPRWGRHPRLAIWGPLEARLQHADVTILGGLNEESWPPRAHPGPWMSRPMLAAFGLPLPERRIGLSAHDFCQGFAAPEVWLTRAARREGAPTVPCRWLLRLQVLLHATAWPQESAARAAPWLHWQRLLDAPGDIAPVSPPAPTPPLTARPRQLSVTQIETWIRDPYAVYARHVLRLRPLEPLDAEPEAADFGTFVHTAINAFLRDPSGADEDAAEACARLQEHGRRAFGDLLERPAVRAFWWPRFQRIARWFVINEASRRDGLLSSFSEIEGRMEITAPGGPFLLTAKADRIDHLLDGSLCVVDYKTGAPPSAKDVETGGAPQLPLEAAIARAGGFPGIPAGVSVSAMEYWHLPGDEAGGSCCPAAKKAVPDDLAQNAAERLAALVATFDDPATPYAALPRPHLAPRFSDYAHLARVKEWTAEAEGEG